MSVNRRTLMRLAAAGLSSALFPLAGCVKKLGQPRDARSLPTPDAPFTKPEDFYAMSIQGAYEADRASYRLKVAGVCDRGLSLSDAALRTGFPPRIVRSTLSCVGNRPGGHLLSSAVFRGARLADVIEAASVSEEATGALITGLDGFAALRSIEDLRRREALLVYDMGTSESDLAPLPIDNGFPARVLTPGFYGYTQTKWIDAITFVDEGGYQEVLRRAIPYMRGNMQLSSGFSRPLGGSFAAGEIEVLGYAFGDGRRIRMVEVREDDGPFHPAEIVFNEPGDDLPPYLWSLFRFSYRAAPGRHVLTSRATYEDGHTQLPGRAFPYSGGSLASITLDIAAGA
jgi:DMSO/TMAO reductase YedYZ molybdopterin-dependent catalytic subunit